MEVTKQNMDFRRANFNLFKDLPGGIPWVIALEDMGNEESCLAFKHYLFQAQDLCISKQ